LAQLKAQVLAQHRFPLGFYTFSHGDCPQVFDHVHQPGEHVLVGGGGLIDVADQGNVELHKVGRHFGQFVQA
jgi:hypothetical protein